MSSRSRTLCGRILVCSSLVSSWSSGEQGKVYSCHTYCGCVNIEPLPILILKKLIRGNSCWPDKSWVNLTATGVSNTDPTKSPIYQPAMSYLQSPTTNLKSTTNYATYTQITTTPTTIVYQQQQSTYSESSINETTYSCQLNQHPTTSNFLLKNLA